MFKTSFITIKLSLFVIIAKTSIPIKYNLSFIHGIYKGFTNVIKYMFSI